MYATVIVMERYASLHFVRGRYAIVIAQAAIVTVTAIALNKKSSFFADYVKEGGFFCTEIAFPIK